MKKDADFEVQRVMPIYHLAIRAVSQLKRDDVNELSGFKTATKPVQLVCETLIIIFNMEKKIIYKGVGRDKHPEIWETAKKFILNNQLLSDCKNYPKDNIQPAVVEKLRPILESPEYEDRILKNASTAAWGLGKWVKAMVQYDDAMKIVKPKRAEAEKAKGEAAEAQAMWDAAVEKLRAVEAEMKLLVQDLDESEAKKKYLQDEYDMAVKKLERANALITKLKDEEKNWEKSLEVNI
jgi:dynein heavy chain